MNILIFIGILLLIPFYAFVELSFYLLPITILGAFWIFGYSLVKKEYQKYAKHLEILLFLITSGVLNFFVEKLLKKTTYFNAEDLIYLRNEIIIGIISCLFIMLFAQKKDIRYFSIFIVAIIIGIICGLYHFVTYVG
jgi:hypothetical protein